MIWIFDVWLHLFCELCTEEWYTLCKKFSRLECCFATYNVIGFEQLMRKLSCFIRILKLVLSTQARNHVIGLRTKEVCMVDIAMFFFAVEVVHSHLFLL